MTCYECQRNLLQMLDPSTPAADVAEHLAQCTVCQQYQLRLLRIETNVPRLPVPSSNALEALKRALLAPETDTTPAEVAADVGPAPLVIPGPAPMAPRRVLSRPRWQLASVGLAAAILLAVVGFFQFFH